MAPTKLRPRGSGLPAAKAMAAMIRPAAAKRIVAPQNGAISRTVCFTAIAFAPPKRTIPANASRVIRSIPSGPLRSDPVVESRIQSAGLGHEQVERAPDVSILGPQVADSEADR